MMNDETFTMPVGRISGILPLPKTTVSLPEVDLQEAIRLDLERIGLATVAQLKNHATLLGLELEIVLKKRKSHI